MGVNVHTNFIYTYNTSLIRSSRPSILPASGARARVVRAQSDSPPQTNPVT